MITGGNRGIGADVVEKLLRCRINVVLGKFPFIIIFRFEKTSCEGCSNTLFECPSHEPSTHKNRYNHNKLRLEDVGSLAYIVLCEGTGFRCRIGFSITFARISNKQSEQKKTFREQTGQLGVELGV